MKKRLGICFAALVMLVLFVIVIAAAVVVTLPLLVVYLFNASAWLYDRIGKFGQALDSCANVPFLDGHPKETISSHVGRFYEAKFGNPYKLRPYATQPDVVIPWQAQFVKWLTDLAEKDHVLHAVEQWAVDDRVPL